MKRICSLGIILLSSLILRAETTVGIYGGVNKPGKYSLRTNQGAIELLHLAGGYLPRCGDNPLQVIATNADGSKTIYELDTRKIIASGQDVQLPQNCIVMVSQCAGFLGEKPQPTFREINKSIEAFVTRDPKELQPLGNVASSKPN